MSVPENILPELWTQSQLCEYLNKSEAWAERARLEGSGPPFLRVGRSIRYDIRDVHKWLGNNRLKSTSDSLERRGQVAK